MASSDTGRIVSGTARGRLTDRRSHVADSTDDIARPAFICASRPSSLEGVLAIGTIDDIRVLQRELGLGLGAAKALVDRCVFDGETVAIEVPSRKRSSSRPMRGRLGARRAGMNPRE